MHKLILTMIVAVTIIPFLVDEGWVPGLFNYVPELLSAIVAVYVLVHGVTTRFRNVRPVYWLLLFILIVDIVCAAIVNHLGAGQAFAGLRNYLRALPFFLLPAVVVFTDRQLRTQLLFLLVVCICQLPLAIKQRLETQAWASYYQHRGTTGDLVSGTLLTSGNLSLFLIAAACMLTPFLMRRKVSGGLYLFLLLLILIPTSLNETKITLLLLPVALLTAFYAGSDPERRLRSTVVGGFVVASFLAIFVTVYDYFIVAKWGYGLLDFFTMDGRLERYIFRGAELGDTWTGPVGRGDGMLAVVTVLGKDIVDWFFGFGIGNASKSSLGRQFVGVYYPMLERFPITSISYVLLELGILGLFVQLSAHFLVFRESIGVAQSDKGIMGAIAAGWAGVSVVVFVALFYETPITTSAFAYLFWYFSGLLAAHSVRATLTNDRPVAQGAAKTLQRGHAG